MTTNGQERLQTSDPRDQLRVRINDAIDRLEREHQAMRAELGL
ncbi:hypothetical protein [Desertivibrio insolitus]|nr:hypothetical protein [Herbiconiux sp. SYSU D00978]